MDAVSLFAITLFSLAWFLRARSDPSEPVVRLFFAALMVTAVLIGVLGLLLRLVS